jgi:hypothetical protein
MAMTLLTILALMYFIPTVVAMLRGHKSKFAIFILNLVGAWTGLFWFVALVWAFGGTTKADEYKVARLHEEATLRALQKYGELRGQEPVALAQPTQEYIIGSGMGFGGFMLAVAFVIVMMVVASSINIG